MRTCNDGSDPNHEGNTSLILLLSTFTSCKALQLINDFGSFPSSWFRLTSNDRNSVALANISGRVPLKLLLRRIRSVRESMEFLKQGGIEPLKRLLDKSKKLNPLVLHIQ
ncbi:unnamed protein product, partial [Brassica oleracea]